MLQSSVEVAPVLKVCHPLGQKEHVDMSRNHPTLQIQSETDVALGPVVLPPLQLTQVVKMLSLYVSAGQMSQLPLVAPSTSVQPLPDPQESSQWTTQTLNPVRTLLSSERQEMTSPAETDKPFGATSPLCSIPPIVNVS